MNGFDRESVGHIVTQGLLETLSVAGTEWQKKRRPRVELRDETRKVEEVGCAAQAGSIVVQYGVCMVGGKVSSELSSRCR